MVLNDEKIIPWSDYKREDGEASPDGQPYLIVLCQQTGAQHDGDGQRCYRTEEQQPK